MANNECNNIPNPMLVVPSTFGECLTYAQQISFLQKEIEELQSKVTTLEAKVAELEDDNAFDK